MGISSDFKECVMDILNMKIYIPGKTVFDYLMLSVVWIITHYIFLYFRGVECFSSLKSYNGYNRQQIATLGCLFTISQMNHNCSRQAGSCVKQLVLGLSVISSALMIQIIIRLIMMS